MTLPALRQPNDGDEGDLSGAPAKSDKDEIGATGAEPSAKASKPLEEMNAAELQKRLAEIEEQKFAAAEFALRQAIRDIPDLKNLADNLIIDRTPEGLRIQIVDQDKLSMFPLGSAEMADSARKLIALVSQVVKRPPNKLSITGHTDARPYATVRNYGNWELSADLANASRRELLIDGLPPERIEKVVGMAEHDPLVPEDPLSARNRRISIVLMREAGEPAASPGARVN